MGKEFTSFHEFRKRYPIKPNDESSFLGSGTYGKVVKVEDQVETEWVAVKISEFKGNDAKSLKAEIELAQKVPRQANIARYDACYRIETDTGISDFAVMKYYPDGNLADLMKKNVLTLPQKEEIIRGILLGLQHLHHHRIIHRDFKPANILISRDNRGRFVPKIADFGLSKLVHDDEIESSDFDLSDGRGTPSYKAPEQIVGGRVSFNLDLWGFGVIMYELLTGEKPFYANAKAGTEQAVVRQIEKKIVNVTLPEEINAIAEPYQSIIRKCLVKDIHQRVRKEEELLYILDGIPPLLAEAKKLVKNKKMAEAAVIYETILAKREQNAEAIAGNKKCQEFIQKEQNKEPAIIQEIHLKSILKTDSGTEEKTDLMEEEMENIARHSTTVLSPSLKYLPPNNIWYLLRSRNFLPVLGIGLLLSSGIYFWKEKITNNSSSVVTNKLAVIPAKQEKEENSAQKKLINYTDSINNQATNHQSSKTNNDVAVKGQNTLIAETKPVEPSSNKPSAKENELVKQQAQEEYDQLVDNGINAINNGNNKAAAIVAFEKASILAEHKGLSTAKAANAYSIYMGKGNRIFESEEYEGAKAWYYVAQSLMNTPEVRKKIKDCENNL